MSKTGMRLESNEDVAYVFLPKHPGKGVSGVTAKQIPLHSIISNYQGPEIFLDFDKSGEIIGLEFLFD
ncbi:DUF2283 domain-containing protein [Xenorhabdus bovienii]|uniref:DUF2283 domain-containing protein n=1 Tax=Xenorhabdus bovienii TaxID=40576 RepID=UPI003DA3FC62